MLLRSAGTGFVADGDPAQSHGVLTACNEQQCQVGPNSAVTAQGVSSPLLPVGCATGSGIESRGTPICRRI